MRFKKILTKAVAMLTTLTLSISAFATDVNWDSASGAGYGLGDGDNEWSIKTDGGVFLYDTEGLRITVYDANDDTKVFNTVDITGNPNIAAVSNIRYFADGSELIPKTTWLSYVKSSYSAASADTTSATRFCNAVTSRQKAIGYRTEYVPELADIRIISTDNTSHLEEIKALVGDKDFLIDLCSLIGGSLKYEDFAAGKYKIAFEPVSYHRYFGYNWAMTATECGLYNLYLKKTKSSDWNTVYNLRAQLGPHTHSNLPRSAFLATKDLSIPVYSPTDSDYYNGNSNYNSDICIIRCMGIGVLSGTAGEEEDLPDGTGNADYHTDTKVYTSFEFTNTGSDDIYGGEQVFSIYNSDGELPMKSEGPAGEEVQIGVAVSYGTDADGHTTASANPVYGYWSDEIEPTYVSETSKVYVFVDNPAYAEDEDGFGVAPYKKLGRFADGDTISTESSFIRYTVTRNSTGATIASGACGFNCPVGEDATGWFEWKTPSYETDVTITITSTDSSVAFYDEYGSMCSSLVIAASISEVVENTPPDPKVFDTKPSSFKLLTESAVLKHGQYTNTATTTLTWYVWTYDWTQTKITSTSSSYNHILSRTPTSSSGTSASSFGGYTYTYEKVSYLAGRYGVDNTYLASDTATHESGSEYAGAVLLGGDAVLHEYSVTIKTEVTLTPAEECPTAKYVTSKGGWVMKSGYGLNVSVKTTLSGNTEYCSSSTQHVNALFPEFGFSTYNRLLEKERLVYVFKNNGYSTYNSRVHFTPIWYPDNANYRILIEVFDIWCPAGQLTSRATDSVLIDGNVYDDWHIAPVPVGS